MQFKFYTLFLFIFLSLPLSATDSSSPINLNYTIHPYLHEDDLLLEVVLKFQAESQKSTYIFLPDSWGGQDKLYKEIKSIECLTPHARLENTEKADIKIIHHSPKDDIEIRYCLKSTHSKETEWYYRPILEKTHFFFFGHCFFIIPESERSKPARITLQWKGFPAEMTLANSFGVQERKQKLYVPISDFQHATYCGGDFSLHQFGEKNSPIYLAIRGNWSFSIDRLAQLSQTIIQTQRNFWNDYNFPSYLITVFTAKDDSYIAGTALTNAFSIFINDFQDSSRANWNSIAWLLSHEHFHTWNGMKMKPSASAGSMTWFTEGFTEYYAAELNLRGNLITFEEYLKFVNTMIYDYYTSPVRNSGNGKIDRKFWSDWTYQRLPYLRGYLLALNWNHQIKTRSDKNRSLDDGMFDLFRRIRKSGKRFNLNDIRRIFGDYLGSSAEQDIDDYIKNGKTIPLAEDIYEDIAAIEWMENVGFNLKTALDYRFIEGVVADSPAYQAGLRNGHYFIDYRTKDDEVQVRISKDGVKSKVIQYPYDRKGELVPQFTLLKETQKIAA